MTTTEMKDILVTKFKDENCCFKKSDISIKKDAKGDYLIVIKDYEHIVFKISFSTDEFFGFEVWVQKYYKDGDFLEYDGILTMVDSKKDYNIKPALIQLGYYIANTF